MSQLNSVIFKDKANATTGRKFISLFPGLGYAAGYKVGAPSRSAGNRERGKTLTRVDRFYKEYINTEVSRWRVTILPNTMAKISSKPSERRQARRSCIRRLAGKDWLFPPRGQRPVNVSNSLIGIGEIVLLPLDVLKIKRQTNPEAFRGRGIFKIVADEGFGLYRGWGWTAARNAPGSFAVSVTTS